MIKVDAYGYGAESDTVYFDVSYASNKIPHLAMGVQRERDVGMISQGIGRGVSQTPEPIGCDHMSMGKPMNP